MKKAVRKMAVKAQLAMYNLLHNEKGEVNIVAIVVLIGIAVILAVIFRGFIINLLNKLFGGIENNADNAMKAPV